MHFSPLVQELPKLEGGELLVRYLADLGVEYFFGVPGGAIEPIYNGLARLHPSGGPRAVVARHESGAAFMAQGYAVESGRLGVCAATSGPGATNAVTAVASAYQDEVPMLIITGQSSQERFGDAPLQDSSCQGINTLGIFSHITRYNSMVTDISQLERKLAQAVMAACGPIPGPAHLTIPVNLLRADSGVSSPSIDLPTLLERRIGASHKMLDLLYRVFAEERRFAFVIGGGCRDAVADIVEVAERLGAPIVTTPGGKGLVDPYHPLYRGVFGFAGHDRAREVLSDPELDRVIVVGSMLGEWDTAGWDTEALLNERMIHIDAVESHFSRSLMASLHVHGRPRSVFQNLLVDPNSPISSMKPTQDYGAAGELHFCTRPVSHDSNDQRIKPQLLMQQLGEKMPAHTRYFADAGNSTAWSIHYLHPRHGEYEALSTGWFRTSTQFASMGWAIGTAMGAAMAEEEAPVVCITGDGSWLMNGQELTVAIEEQRKVIFVVLNDNSLGMVKHGQRMAGAEPIAFELPSVNFAAIAEAMGAQGVRLESVEQLLNLSAESLLDGSGPVVLDVCIDPEEVPPMGSRVKVLNGS